LTSPEKYSAIAAATETAHSTGQPVLIGTTSIEQSLKVADVLDQRHIPYEILNAKTVDQEIRIIESAGRHGRVTIATNMAGRGTDILLDDAAKAQGGLFVIGTERHESVRIDNQLRGRAGRQGDPGLTRFYLSLEDELPRRFARERLERVKKKIGPVTGPISAKEAQQLMAYAQETCESVNRSVRDDLVQLEEVISEQRLAIYRLRNQIVDSATLDQFVQPFAARTVHAYLDQYLTDDLVPEEWPIELLTTELEQLLHQPVELPLADSIETIKQQLEPLIAAVDQRMALQITEDEETARRFMLLALDEQWTSHLTAMNSLKEGIHLRSYGQEQPVRIFEREGMDYFRYAIFSFEKQVVSGLCRLEETTLQGGLLHATVD